MPQRGSSLRRERPLKTQPITLLLAAAVGAASISASAAETAPNCKLDAMLVFDASGSMAGTDMNSVSPHIEKVRRALAHVLPSVAPVRDLGLIVYGPGSHADRCENIDLKLRPAPNSADEIMAEVDSVTPAGQTPLAASVSEAADVLSFRDKPAEIVVLTDGEETCRGDPCALARTLKTQGKQLTIHVVGFRPRGTPALDAPLTSRCMADETGGQYISTETEQELEQALAKTLGCPFITLLPPDPAVSTLTR